MGFCMAPWIDRMALDATTIMPFALLLGAWTVHGRPVVAGTVLAMGLALSFWPF